MAKRAVGIERALTYVEAIYGPFPTTGGVSERTLATAERRLGVALPAALRALYLRSGRVKALHARHNRLRKPATLTIDADHLVFYDENQEVTRWAIARSALSKNDPPVVQAQCDDQDRWTFYPEFPSVSAFLEAQGTWQAIQGGLRFSGVRSKWPGRAPSRRADHVSEVMKAWLIDGGVLALVTPAYLGLATRSAAHFVAASKALGLELGDWDHATLQDR